MSDLTFEAIRKTFGSNVALHGLDLAVNEGELISLLGPSGCGKTTALRICAGFEVADSGRVLVSGSDISGKAPHKRNMGMVFQSYSLFPNLTVSSNIEYGLRTRKVAKQDAHRRVQEMIELTELTQHANKYPHQLSGGQQQRVALARALAIQPSVLLLDEPLSALDAKVRANLRDQIRRIQTEVGITTLFVTHDQEEALAISDRIAVMSQGRMEQLGTPTEIYRHPSTAFVARFIGSMNQLPATVIDGDAVRVQGHPVTVARGTGLSAGASADLLVRPEDTHFTEGPGLRGHVVSQTFQGIATTVGVRLTGIDALVDVHVVGSVEGKLQPGDEVTVTFDGAHAVVEATSDSAMAIVSAVREHRFDVDAVVFDKDGTLLDLDASWAPIATAWVAGIAPEGGDVARLICDALGLDAATGRLRPDSSFAMLPLVEIAADTRLLLDAEGWSLDRIEDAIERAVAAVDGLTHDKHMDTLVDVPGLFANLRAGGLRLAVFTSDEPEPTTLFLDAFALHDLVDVVITAADVADAKPSPEGLLVIAGALGVKPSRLMMVGDSIADRDSALAAGSVFVSVGHATRAAVGANTSVTTVAELRTDA